MHGDLIKDKERSGDNQQVEEGSEEISSPQENNKNSNAHDNSRMSQNHQVGDNFPP